MSRFWIDVLICLVIGAAGAIILVAAAVRVTGEVEGRGAPAAPSSVEPRFPPSSLDPRPSTL